MTIEWGSWQYRISDGKGIRVGIEVVEDPVSCDNPSWSVTVHVYTENSDTWPSDSQTLTHSGDGFGSEVFTNDDGTTPQLRDSFAVGGSHSGFNNPPFPLTFTSSLSGVVGGITPGVTVNYAPAGRPFCAPDQPTGVSSTRNSDTQITTNWTRQNTAARPYTSQTIEMATWVSGVGWSDYGSPINVSATATSHARTGLAANGYYAFRVRANNTVGSSDWSGAAGVFTTPSPPAAVLAQRIPGGIGLTVTPAHLIGAGLTKTVQRRVDGGAWSTITSASSADITTQFGDLTAPSSGLVEYQIRVDTPSGGLHSTYTMSNSVTAAIAPNAPTLLDPNGEAQDLETGQFTMTWQHNPGTDYASQSMFSIETSDDGGSGWDPLVTDQVDTDSEYLFNGAVTPLVNGTTYLWRVRTKGISAPGYGAWSTPATIIGSSFPTATLDPAHPADPTVAFPVDVQWVYNQDESSPQAGWRVYLLGGVALDEQLEYAEGTGTTSTYEFDYAFEDGETYRTEVWVQSAAGLWSEVPAFAEFLIDIAPPAPIDTTATFDECSATVLLSLEPQAADVGEVAVTHAKIERRINGGEWIVLTHEAAVPVDFIDTLPITNGTNEYRITSISATPSYFINDVITVEGTDGDPGDGLWVFLSYGDAFETILRLQGDVALDSTSGRTREAQHFLGRAKPVLLVGQNTDYIVGVSGLIRYDDPNACDAPDDCTFESVRADWETAGLTAEVACLRDYTGRRIFGMLSEVSCSDGPYLGMASVGFSVTETDYDELPVTVEV